MAVVILLYIIVNELLVREVYIGVFCIGKLERIDKALSEEQILRHCSINFVFTCFCTPV